MGVEYEHWFFVRDLAWTGDKATAERVHALLHAWGLVAAKPTIFDLAGGKSKKVTRSLRDAAAIPPNLLLVYPFVETPRAEEIMGPSAYPPESIGPRYFQALNLVLGTDHRLLAAHERGLAELVRAPRRGGAEVKPYPANDARVPAHLTFPDGPAPEATLSLEGDAPTGLSGVWRSGLGLDCGKDVPAFPTERYGPIPCREFVSALEAAFGTQLVEVGWFH
jgi:hypothetical protein